MRYPFPTLRSTSPTVSTAYSGDSIGEPVFLLGHSFGALCSLEAALLTPNVRKLVLYEPPIPIEGGPDFHPPTLLERLEGLMAAGQPDEVVATFLEEVAGQDPRPARSSAKCAARISTSCNRSASAICKQRR